MTRWVLAASISLLVLFCAASPTAAHTDLVSVSPGDGNRVGDWPSVVVLVFTEAVDPSLSAVSISVDREQSARISLGRGDSDAELVGDLGSLEPARATSPHRVRVSYRVTSADGHPIAGTSTFTVDTTKSDPRGGASDGEVQSVGSTPAPPDTATSRIGVAVWLVGGLLALVLVSAVAPVRRMRALRSGEQEGLR